MSKEEKAVYDAARYAANPQKYNAHSAVWRKANTEGVKLYNAAYRQDNREKMMLVASAYSKANRPKRSAYQAMRNARKLHATPAWADLDAIKAVYLEAARQQLTVDHAVPLQGKTVCGLHVHYNLQLLTKSQNISKGNRHWPDMPTKEAARSGYLNLCAVCWIEGLS